MEIIHINKVKNDLDNIISTLYMEYIIKWAKFCNIKRKKIKKNSKFKICDVSILDCQFLEWVSADTINRWKELKKCALELELKLYK